MIIIQRIASLVIGYFFGLIQTGYIIGKLNNVDVRKYGSGNSGTTNVMRTMGKKFGVITFLVDALKATAAVALCLLIFRNSAEGHYFIIALYAGLGTILGHNFPFYLQFNGGKGIAAIGGLSFALAIFDWKFLVLAIASFALTAAITKYVSLGSLVMTFSFMAGMIIWGQTGHVHGLNDGDRIEAYILMIIIFILAVIRHKSNIKRLMNGTERKIGDPKENIEAPRKEE